MKYQLDAPLVNIDGKTPMTDATGAALTFKVICSLALIQATDKEGEQKYKAFALAVKLETAVDSVELSAEEVARLKRLIGELMPPIVVGRMYDLLEQATPA